MNAILIGFFVALEGIAIATIATMADGHSLQTSRVRIALSKEQWWEYKDERRKLVKSWRENREKRDVFIKRLIQSAILIPIVIMIWKADMQNGIARKWIYIYAFLYAGGYATMYIIQTLLIVVDASLSRAFKQDRSIEMFDKESLMENKRMEVPFMLRVFELYFWSSFGVGCSWLLQTATGIQIPTWIKVMLIFVYAQAKLPIRQEWKRFLM